MTALLQFHHWLLADQSRTNGYREAINRTVRTTDVVLDIGTGTGILAFFACLAGARKVYAVERNESIELARVLSSTNGFDDRIEFLNHRSQNIDLPESVDIIISDMGSSFGLQEGALGSLLDARRRFLKPGGQILPQSLDFFVAPVELNNAQSLDVWNKDRYGLDLSSIRRFVARTTFNVDFESANFLASPELITNVCFQETETLFVAGEALSVTQRSGVMHGLVAWITVNLIPGISLTNSPLNPTVDWAQSLFPVETPVALHAGDRVRTKISTYDGQAWRWQVEITDGAAPDAAIKAKFDHSTLGGFPIRPEQFKKKLPQYAPKLSRKGEAEAYVLGAFDGKRTAKELMEEVTARFADCFPTKTAAAEFVSRVIERCS